MRTLLLVAGGAVGGAAALYAAFWYSCVKYYERNF